jgi:hypothetical protein
MASGPTLAIKMGILKPRTKLDNIILLRGCSRKQTLSVLDVLHSKGSKDCKNFCAARASTLEPVGVITILG